ncbi:S-adenosyl-L-homocysteine hydrolase [Sulfitobacter sp. S223]|uniref:S-adenosyl-L-homocysteine hydrolase n=1 Tax=Sulfitobacter sp. S223 TaxID=2867023 RepID=UPI0021A9100E|nr:S-adenosyl-L-homocysteine hydrolase [Sulfitobacter sp. S223]UWR26354.1 S-adenosyl-L-homocysteine hydrolase [Sulfitobacter sp. S223]
MKTALMTIAAFSVMATAATAQEVCMSAVEMQSSLIDWYGERPVAGPTQDNTRLWVSDATGSWTLVRNLSDGNACVEAQGRNWSADNDAEEMLTAIQARTEG